MLRIDEESSPDWLTDEFKEKIERHCRLILSNIVITGECKKKLIAGRTLILSNFDGKNTNFKNCQIIYIDNSTTGYIANSKTGDIAKSTTGDIYKSSSVKSIKSSVCNGVHYDENGN